MSVWGRGEGGDGEDQSELMLNALCCNDRKHRISLHSPSVSLRNTKQGRYKNWQSKGFLKQFPPLKTIGGERGRARWQNFILLGAGVQSQTLPELSIGYVPCWTSLFKLQYHRDLKTIQSHKGSGVTWMSHFVLYCTKAALRGSWWEWWR